MHADEWLVLWTAIGVWGTCASVYGTGYLVVDLAWAWTACNALLMMASIVTGSRHLLCWSKTASRTLVQRAALWPIEFVHVLCMWTVVQTLFRKDAVATHVPGTRIWVANLHRYCHTPPPRRACVLVDCTEEACTPRAADACAKHVLVLPSLDNTLPTVDAMVATALQVRRLVEAEGDGDQDIVVACMYGHCRSAAFACILANYLAHERYPTWETAFLTLTVARPSVHIDPVRHHSTLNAVSAALEKDARMGPISQDN